MSFMAMFMKMPILIAHTRIDMVKGHAKMEMLKDHSVQGDFFVLPLWQVAGLIFYNTLMQRA